jgi:pseudaminic acid synthase
MKPENEVFIIAELSANHKHKKEVAIETIKAAKKSGADAIKLQTYTPDTITLNCNNDYFQIKEGLWKGKTLYELYKEAFTPWEWHEDLFRIAKEEGIICFSTPFDNTAIDFLEKFNTPIYKIASFEIQDIPLIKYASSKGKPIIISTGIADFEDIDLAVKTCRNNGNNDITLLKCTSSYPTAPELSNLATIPDLRDKFNVKVGLSDHSLGITAPLVAVSLGATVIEKHFILDKEIDGPDVSFSLASEEFSLMVKSIREAELMIGKVDYSLNEQVNRNRQKGGRSLFVVQDIKKGEEFTHENIRSIRPGYGLHPKHYNEIIGKKASKDLNMGEPLNWNHIV